MTRGRAKCKKCGTLVVGEVERDLECPGCQRIFQIPDAPQYTRPLRGHTLARLSLNSGVLSIESSEYSGEMSSKWELPKAPRPRDFRITRSLSFPERNDPVLWQEEGVLKLIVEFYNHKLGDIEITLNDGHLVLRSRLPTCSYKNIIALPEGFGTICQTALRHGILEIILYPIL